MGLIGLPVMRQLPGLPAAQSLVQLVHHARTWAGNSPTTGMPPSSVLMVNQRALGLLQLAQPIGSRCSTELVEHGGQQDSARIRSMCSRSIQRTSG